MTSREAVPLDATEKWPHLQLITCDAPMSWGGTYDAPAFSGRCGGEKRDAIHDMFSDVARRDRLSPPLTEKDRHAFLVGTPEDMCAFCRDEWPCASQRYLDQLRAERIDVEQLRESMIAVIELMNLPGGGLQPVDAGAIAAVYAEYGRTSQRLDYAALASQTREEGTP
jgi:hypothetical protein